MLSISEDIFTKLHRIFVKFESFPFGLMFPVISNTPKKIFNIEAILSTKWF